MPAGVTLCAVTAFLAIVLGRAFPFVGAPVLAIVIGVAIAAARPPSAGQAAVIRFIGKYLLQLGIVLLGATLQLHAVGEVGARSLPVLVGTAVITLTFAYLIGRLLHVDRDLRRLLGIGTTICGGSAIAALAAVTDVDQADVAYAIATVFLFNVLAVLTFPWFGRLLDLSEHAFGLWAGTAINDTSSVVAAGYVYGHVAGNEAVIVKLTRTLLIIPIVLFYAGKAMRAAGRETMRRWTSVIPWFVIWFLLAVLCNSLGIVPARAYAPLTQAALLVIVVALAGVGLGANVQQMRAAGVRPLLLGAALWIIIACSSLVIARAAHLS